MRAYKLAKAVDVLAHEGRDDEVERKGLPLVGGDTVNVGVGEEEESVLVELSRGALPLGELGGGEVVGGVDNRVDASEVVEELLGIGEVRLALVELANAQLEQRHLGHGEDVRLTNKSAGVGSLRSNLSEEFGSISSCASSLVVPNAIRQARTCVAL